MNFCCAAAHYSTCCLRTLSEEFSGSVLFFFAGCNLCLDNFIVKGIAQMISEQTREYYELGKRNDVRESAKRLRRQYLRYKDAEIVYSIQHKKLLELASKAGAIYRIDTNTCVFPSLHVAISIALASVWSREKGISPWVKAGILWFCAMVCLSVCFVKQHSVWDVLGAVPVCLVAEWLVFGRKKKPIENKKEPC